MTLNNGVSNRQPQPIPLFFRAEKWIKNSRKIVGRNARAGVADGDVHAAGIRRNACADTDFAVGVNRLNRVEQKIQQRLCYLVAVEAHRRQFIGKIAADARLLCGGILR